MTLDSIRNSCDVFIKSREILLKTKTRLPLRVNIVVLGAAVTMIMNQSASAGQWVHIMDLIPARYTNISKKLGHVKICDMKETRSCGKTGQ